MKQISQKDLLEEKKIESEIQEKEGILLVKKIEILLSALSDYFPTGENKDGDRVYTPIITLEVNRQIIEEKIMKLIKNL